LARVYGGRAHDVLQIAEDMHQQRLQQRLAGGNSNAIDNEGGVVGEWAELLVSGFPVLEAEVIFAVRHDWALHPEDFLARRSRLLFLDKSAALRALPTVVRLMTKELQWSETKQEEELKRCVEYMRHFGGAQPLTKEGGETADDSSSRRLRLATATELKDAYRRVQPSFAPLTSSQLELVAELLQHPLSEAELADCLEQSKQHDGKVTFDSLQSWWNSERLNPGLTELRQRKMATADQVEGSGTVFG
jgi:hypothetical protein